MKKIHFWSAIFSLGILWSQTLAAQAHEVWNKPIFDSHLHYALEDTQTFTPRQILQKFDDNQIAYALISSTPNDGTEALYRAAPKRIIPFLGLYKELWHGKRAWMWDETTLPRMRAALKTGIYRGLGEFHLFEKDLNSPIFEQVIALAKEKQMLLQVHGDAAVIDRIYQLYPQATILWAHMGTRPEPAFLRSVLKRHPEGLYIDTSVRDGQLLGDEGRLSKEWQNLFIEFQDRFLVGVDTFSVNRWRHFDEVVRDIRTWLGQLPEPVAQKLAYDNAYQLFFPRLD